jgi:hypothetical protein
MTTDQFLHGINPRNWLACWNLTLSPRIASSDFAALNDPGLHQHHRPIRDFPIAEIEQGNMPPGVLTPRTSSFLTVASIDRRGERAGLGATDTNWLSNEEQTRRRRIDDVELAFERQRRESTPEAASRYGCLWLAENDDRGRAHITSMLPEVCIMTAKVVDLHRLTKCDTAWFDAYFENRNPEFLEAYWSGVPMKEEDPHWEYLLEGLLQFDPGQIDDLCLTAMSLGAWPSGVEILPRVLDASQRKI